ncbi:hypothetical protein FE257_008707 [Aspergillus nanangensis]|uniref:Uncharacterized protein n=1 Tax=Aspergillus nanangensis TaxID=2582783 RepID=A0AAD4CKX7_ASPNN|nr:hypothetical protein FE257_008707 [Aspergillus nanangensis]
MRTTYISDGHEWVSVWVTFSGPGKAKSMLDRLKKALRALEEDKPWGLHYEYPHKVDAYVTARVEIRLRGRTSHREAACRAAILELESRLGPLLDMQEEAEEVAKTAKARNCPSLSLGKFGKLSLW